MIAEFCRSSASTALSSVDGNKIEHQAGFNHCFNDGNEFPRVANTQLDPNGLTSRQVAQFVSEVQKGQR